jgi:hypothetical protein
MSIEDGKARHGRDQKERHKIAEEIRSFQDINPWPGNVLHGRFSVSAAKE